MRWWFWRWLSWGYLWFRGLTVSGVQTVSEVVVPMTARCLFGLISLFVEQCMSGMCLDVCSGCCRFGGWRRRCRSVWRYGLQRIVLGTDVKSGEGSWMPAVVQAVILESRCRGVCGWQFRRVAVRCSGQAVQSCGDDVSGYFLQQVLKRVS